MEKEEGSAVKVWPAIVKTEVGEAELILMVEVPMARMPLEASEMGVPEMVMPLPPAVRVWPSIEKDEGLAVKV